MARDSFRAFSPDLEAIAESWAKSAVTEQPWKDGGPFGNTESKPFSVSCGNLSGIAKPGEKKTDNICRAAHEKITSDLAFELKLPIPSVILWDMGEKVDAARDRYVAISAWAFPQPVPWGPATATLTDQQKTEASQVMSAMLAFETWVSCIDRKADHVLVYLPGSGQPLQLAFIDFAYSLSQQWTSTDAPVVATGSYLPLPQDEDSLKTMVDRIEQFSDQSIGAILNRVPIQYLPEGKKALIMANLKSRKQKLRSLFLIAK